MSITYTMEISLDSIRRISGSASGDRECAEKFCRQAMAIARECKESVSRYTDLQPMISAAGLAEARDHIAAARQLWDVMQELASFFEQSQLRSVFQVALEEVGTNTMAAMESYTKIRKYLAD